MKRLAVSTVLLLALAATPAAAQSIFDSTSLQNGNFYAGVIGGFTNGNVAGYYAGTGGGGGGAPPAVAYDFTLRPHGLSFGVFGGYELPWDRFVLRLEGDAAFVAGASQTYTYPPDPTRQDTVSIGATGHVRGLVGMPMGTFTPFVAAGLGFASVTASHQGPVTGGGTQTWTQHALYAGPSIGVGTDIALGDGINARLEVLADIFASRRFDWEPGRYSDIPLVVVTARGGVSIPF